MTPTHHTGTGDTPLTATQTVSEAVSHRHVLRTRGRVDHQARGGERRRRHSEHFRRRAVNPGHTNVDGCLRPQSEVEHRIILCVVAMVTTGLAHAENRTAYVPGRVDRGPGTKRARLEVGDTSSTLR